MPAGVSCSVFRVIILSYNREESHMKTKSLFGIIRKDICLCLGLLCLAIVIAVIVGCGSDPYLPQHVNVTPNETYYKVTIDYTTGDRYNIGREYGMKVLDAVPDYEQLTDSYLKELEESGTALTDLRDPRPPEPFR